MIYSGTTAKWRRFTKLLAWRKGSSRRAKIIGLIVVFGCAGLLLLTASGAASFLASREAEHGNLQGSAAPSDGDGASNGQAVRFDQASGGRRVNVSNAGQLTAALQSAAAGDIITLADGTYSGNFNSTASGKASQPITLTGSRNAIIKGPSSSAGYTLSLGTMNGTDQISYWRITGISIISGKKGLILDRVQHSVVDGILVRDTGEEGIHLRNFSSDNIVQNSTVTRTGLLTQGYGEGLYVGTAVSNWSNTSQGKPDNSNNNQLLNNTVSQTAAESIDIKEGTHGGVIRGNNFDGTGMCANKSMTCNSADSFMDMKGEKWLVENNVGSHVRVSWNDGSPESDGFQTHQVSGAESELSGNSNTFRNNRFDDLGGYGFNISSKTSGNVVECNNQVSNVSKGLSNSTCR